jgi:hypothetical protein
MIRESIKWRVKEVDGTALLHEVAPDLAQISQQLRAGAPIGGNGDGSGGEAGAEGGSVDDQNVRVALGHAIRKLKQHWKLGVLLAPLVHHPSSAQPLGVEDVGQTQGGGSGGGSGGGGASAAQLAEAAAAAAAGRDTEAVEAAAWAAGQVGTVNELLAAVHAFGLQDCWQWKPLLDGKEVSMGRGLAQLPVRLVPCSQRFWLSAILGKHTHNTKGMPFAGGAFYAWCPCAAQTIGPQCAAHIKLYR